MAGVKRKYWFELGYHAFSYHLRNIFESDIKSEGDAFFSSCVIVVTSILGCQ